MGCREAEDEGKADGKRELAALFFLQPGDKLIRRNMLPVRPRREETVWAYTGRTAPRPPLALLGRLVPGCVQRLLVPSSPAGRLYGSFEPALGRPYTRCRSRVARGILAPSTLAIPNPKHSCHLMDCRPGVSARSSSAVPEPPSAPPTSRWCCWTLSPPHRESQSTPCSATSATSPSDYATQTPLPLAYSSARAS